MEKNNLAIQGQTNGIEKRGLMDALDASQSRIWFDPDGMVVDANVNAERMFTYSGDDIMRQDYFALCGTGSTQQLAEKREWNRIASGEMIHVERSYKTKDGREIWSSVNFAALKNEDGTTRRVVAIFIDLSRFAWKPNDAKWAGY